MFKTPCTPAALRKQLIELLMCFRLPNRDRARAGLSESLRAVIAQTLLKRADGKGRVAALEIMIGIPAVRNLIREAKIHRSLNDADWKSIWMQTMDQVLVELVMKKSRTMEEAMTKTSNVDLFKNFQQKQRENAKTFIQESKIN